MRFLRAIAALIILATTAEGALTLLVHDSRRTFLQRTMASTAAFAGLACGGVPLANAAYTREVGGSDKSAEQAAYNIQVCVYMYICICVCEISLPLPCQIQFTKFLFQM